jgi:hypothetical protein
MRVRLLREVSGIGDAVRCSAVATAIRKAHPKVLVDFVGIAPYASYVTMCPDIHRSIRVGKGARSRDQDWTTVYSKGIYSHTVDLYCPAFKYERENWPDITKDRVEVWTDAASEALEERLEPCKPVIEMTLRAKRAGKAVLYRNHVLPKGERKKPFIGLCLGSHEGLRRLTSKQAVQIPRLLKAADCEVFGITEGFTTEQLWGIIYQLDLLITTDTGPLHMAGVLDIPTLCVASTAEGGLLTKWYDSVQYINPPFGPETCSGHCYYVGQHEIHRECRQKKRCAAMANIAPELIARVALEIVCG